MILGKSARQQRADPVAQAAQLLSSTDADLTDLDDLIDIIIKKNAGRPVHSRVAKHVRRSWNDPCADAGWTGHLNR